ncbi:SpoIIIAH-like family protein [Sedimentibacter sp. MB31-C6]|uniref:SpoIIIAH-like family protein n=1 Tax=Sedimentibacter sp. MB31-C6 TaxID=3109366 RepID=UPI002DDDBB1B|nr:SpoIIIAH-like family protein [Sedimentibacter sp. MB36-C1]WSI04186.1 SpoIIIAH-like family protein [Sedimentibacter sp. MB36-C1]WSI05637.1 SpoIIIAH-like family protein [Sedimentibacter sp. MB36-C1]
MIMKKETLVFLTSLAIIFIIGYVNMTMEPANTFDENEYAQIIDETISENNEEKSNAIIVEGETETDYEILGDITDITDIESITASTTPTEEASSNTLNISFNNFKLNKEKSNMEVIDHLEGNISNSLISDDTKQQFENLLLNKNNFIETEQDIELMLQSKGYNESVAIVDDNMVKVITNDTLEQADVTKILDIIVSETNYETEQIKIVKFDNIEL